MKKQHKILLSAFLSSGVITFVLMSPLKQSIHDIVGSKKSKIENLDPAVALKKKGLPSRSIASIPKFKVVKQKIKNREVIGHVDNLKNIKFNNKINKDWKDKYQSHFTRMLSGKKVKDFKVELKRSIVKVKNNIGTNLEHVLVSYLRPNGHPFAFEALIDSETGSIVQTWNKTRYEHSAPIRIDGSKYEYQKEK